MHLPRWSRAFAGERKDHRFYELIEDTLKDGFSYGCSAFQESPMTESAKPRAIGLNHIALEVGDIEKALAFYGHLFEFKLRGKNDKMAFIDLGD